MDKGAAFELQLACDAARVPSVGLFSLWQTTALELSHESRRGVTIRVVDPEEMIALNTNYRGQDKVTNVLSFPFDPIDGVDIDLLGDIAICAVVVADEAVSQEKTAEAHWAHMTVHGVLHLCGYDHVEEDKAQEMESLEVEILSALGYPNPYFELNIKEIG